MKILCTGLSRTGTSSLHHALQALGFSSLHYDTERLNHAIAATDLSQVNFRVYDDIDAVSDLPSAWFHRELRQAYPGLKCIHTVRDEDAWWRSIQAHFDIRHPVPNQEADPFRWQLRNLVYGSAHAEESAYRKVYRDHNAAVLQSLPSQDLLVMDIIGGDGWDKLCPFLDRPVPPHPFPHQNSEREFNSWQEKLRQTREEIERATRNESFILLDEDQLRTELKARAIPFTNRDGVYWGPPADDEAAINECEQLRHNGARFIVVAWPAFWWLEHYRTFHQHLREHATCVHRSERSLIFDLSAPRKGQAA